METKCLSISTQRHEEKKDVFQMDLNYWGKTSMAFFLNIFIKCYKGHFFWQIKENNRLPDSKWQYLYYQNKRQPNAKCLSFGLLYHCTTKSSENNIQRIFLLKFWYSTEGINCAIHNLFLLMGTKGYKTMSLIFFQLF